MAGDDTDLTAQLVSSQRTNSKQYILSLLLGCGGFYFGYGVGIFNPLGDIMLKQVYGFESDKDVELYSGLLNTFFSVGALAGVMVSGNLVDRFGRRPSMIATDIVVMACAGLYLIKNINVVLAARFLSGVLSGLYSSIGPVMMVELLPNSVCGFGNAFGYTFLTFAILVAYCTPYVFSPEMMRDYCTYLLAFPSFIGALKFFLTPMLLRTDTPKFIYQSEPDKTIAREKVISAYGKIYDAEVAEAVADETINNFDKAGESAGEGATQDSVFAPAMRLRLISGVFVCFAQQVSGINFLIFYSTELFKELGKDKVMTIVIGLANFGGSFIATAVISRLGRKFNIVVGSLFQGVGMLLLFIGFQMKEFSLLAAAVVIYMLAFAIGLGGSQMAYLSEILTPKGISFACGMQWIMTAAIAQSLLTLKSLFGATALILFFTVACFIFTITLDYLMIETKGKSNETVAKEFQERRYRFFNFK